MANEKENQDPNTQQENNQERRNSLDSIATTDTRNTEILPEMDGTGNEEDVELSEEANELFNGFNKEIGKAIKQQIKNEKSIENIEKKKPSKIKFFSKNSNQNKVDKLEKENNLLKTELGNMLQERNELHLENSKDIPEFEAWQKYDAKRKEKLDQSEAVDLVPENNKAISRPRPKFDKVNFGKFTQPISNSEQPKRKKVRRKVKKRKKRRNRGLSDL